MNPEELRNLGLEKTAVWDEYRAQPRHRKDLPVFLAKRADAMRDELLVRIAELEAQVGRWKGRQRSTEQKLGHEEKQRARAEAALIEWQQMYREMHAATERLGVDKP